MLRRLFRIVCAAGITIAVTAAMAAPASSRALAAGPASTPVPVDVTGDMTWTYVYTPLAAGQSGTETQTLTFHIGVTGLDPVTGLATGNSSSFSFTDSLNEKTVSSDGCQVQVTGGGSSGGPVAMDGFTGPDYGDIAFPQNYTQAEVGVHVYYPLTQTTTFSGSEPWCTNSTSTTTEQLQANPGCYTNQGPIEPGGPLQGTYPDATVNLDCSGTAGNQDWSEDTTITGTLTITPSCSAAAVPSGSQEHLGATASACGLTIDSPPQNAIIPVTDKNYVDGPGVPITGISREPDPDDLRLKVSGTSTCQGPVTVNGVSATMHGDAWDAPVPVAPLGYGPVTLTAKAAGCDDATRALTLINLEITKPVEQDSLPITAEPAMPDMSATISLFGYPGDTSGVKFYWALDVRGETVSRSAPRSQLGDWHPYSHETTGSTTGTGEAWKPSFDEIVGGVGRLIVTASLPGVSGTVTSFPRWINIPGDGLPKATVIDYVDASAPAQYAPKISQLFCVESRWTQFNPKAVNGDDGIVQPPIPNVPDDWAPNPGPRQPEYGHPAGIGIAQLDAEVGELPLADYWNWHTNVLGGIALFVHEKIPAARGLVADEQDRLSQRRAIAIARAEANRKKEHKSGDPFPALVKVPPLSEEEILWQAVRLYNGNFDEFHYNADYILSANGLNVELVRPDTAALEAWVGGADLFSGHGLPGVPRSQAGYWQGLGNHSHVMRWVDEGGVNQTYDEQVRVCPD